MKVLWQTPPTAFKEKERKRIVAFLTDAIARTDAEIPVSDLRLELHNIINEVLVNIQADECI